MVEVTLKTSTPFKINLIQGDYYDKQLATGIVGYFNVDNRGKFTGEEIEEFVDDYVYFIENQIEDIIDMLEEEYNYNNDVKLLEFIDELNYINNF